MEDKSFPDDMDYIDVHTTDKAIEDGLLVRLDRLVSRPYLPVTREGKLITIVTRTVFDAFAKPEENKYLIAFDRKRLEPAYGISEVVAAAKAAAQGEEHDGMYLGHYKGRRLYLMPNETGTMTLMFPEDY